MTWIIDTDDQPCEYCGYMDCQCKIETPEPSPELKSSFPRVSVEFYNETLVTIYKMIRAMRHKASFVHDDSSRVVLVDVNAYGIILPEYVHITAYDHNMQLVSRHCTDRFSNEHTITDMVIAALGFLIPLEYGAN